MKKNKSFISGFLVLVATFFGSAAFAQDDLYYDPATDASAAPVYENSNREDSKVTKQYREDDYYDEDEYAYEYSSRIRRFHRTTQVIDYYDPYFVDMWNYDPFYLPGASIYVGGYNDYWTWRRWNRWRSWNSWSFYDPYGGFGFNSWGYGWNRPWGGYYNAWNNPYVYNNYYYDPYWTWNGYNPYYCSNNAWGNNGYYYENNGGGNNNGGYTPKTYTGARRGGTTVNPGYTRFVSTTPTTAHSNGRLTSTTKGVPVIELQNRPNGRVEPVTKSPTGVGDRSGAARPTTTPNTPSRGDARPSTNGRVNNPESARPTTAPRPARDIEPTRDDRPSRTEPSRPAREVTPNRDARPNRESRPDREVSPNRESRPSREVSPDRGERPSREVSPSREARPSRSNNDGDGGSFDRPSRRSSEPSYDRPSRSSGNSERSQPSRSNDSGRSIDSGSRGSNSGSSGRSGSSSSGGGKRGRD